ncbi:hypothetical protein J6590_050522 [Homalodisca vitripennis]|nr:hypothetical protein J6590_050522 [Homalodisca vitripennis]
MSVRMKDLTNSSWSVPLRGIKLVQSVFSVENGSRDARKTLHIFVLYLPLVVTPLSTHVVLLKQAGCLITRAFLNMRKVFCSKKPLCKKSSELIWPWWARRGEELNEQLRQPSHPFPPPYPRATAISIVAQPLPLTVYTVITSWRSRHCLLPHYFDYSFHNERTK